MAKEIRPQLLRVKNLIDRWAGEENRDGLLEPLLDELKPVLTQLEEDPPSPSSDVMETVRAVPDTIGPWKIQTPLGEGGMGAVFLAQKTGEVSQTAAIKIVKMASPEILKRFERERHIMAQLKHPHITHYLDSGTLPDGRPWLAMEYVEGQPLDVYCQEHGLNMKMRIRLFLKICDAVSHAHHHMIIHRDLKPSNILIDARGEPRLLDFGIATLVDPTTGSQHTITQLHGPLMTPDYASPEQVMGKPLGAASDVYTLGIILYELLVGSRPYKITDHSPTSIVNAICKNEIPRPSRFAAKHGKTEFLPTSPRSLRGDLDNILLKALERTEERRYASVEELIADINRYLKGRPVLARPGTLYYRATKFMRRYAWPLSLGAVLVLSLTGLLISSIIQHQQTEIQRSVAEREREAATQVTDFLVSLLDSADPDQSLGQKLTVKEMLDQGRLQIEHGLTDQQQVRARLLLTLGSAYTSLGMYGQADQLLSEAKHIFLDEGNEGLVETLLVLCKLRLLQKRYKEGIKLGDEALATANAMNALELIPDIYFYKGEHLMKLNRSQEAEMLFREALKICLERYGEIHEKVAKCYNNLGVALRNQGHDEEAMRLYGKALTIYRQTYGDHHSLIHQTLTNIGVYRLGLGQFEEAEAYLEEALRVSRNLYEDDHPVRIASLSAVSNIYREQGRYEDAEEKIREALAMQRRLAGKNGQKVGGVLQNYGALLKEKGDYERAEPLFREALGIYKATYGEEHTTVARAMDGLAAVLNDKGDHGMAGEIYRGALAMRIRILGIDHFHTGISHYNLASHYRRQDQPAQGLKQIKRCLEILQKTLTADHWFVYLARAQKGALLTGLQRYEEAEPLMLRAFDVLLEKKGTGAQSTQDIARWLAELYEAQKRKEPAGKWRRWLKEHAS